MAMFSMIDTNNESQFKQCARLVNVTYETLLSCQTGLKGVELQLKAENQTHVVARPYPPFVPFVVYNRVGFDPFSNFSKQ